MFHGGAGGAVQAEGVRVPFLGGLYMYVLCALSCGTVLGGGEGAGKLVFDTRRMDYCALSLLSGSAAGSEARC